MKLEKRLRYWRTVRREPPYLLAGDEILVDAAHASRSITLTSYEAFYRSSVLEDRGGRAFHLGLLPAPIIGSVAKASVYILSLNPGVSPTDYFGEYQLPAYRRRVLRNLRQSHGNSRYPCYFLDPAVSWHGGFRYWEGRLNWLASGLAAARNSSYQDGLEKLATAVCFLELVPYHSASYGLPTRLLSELTSVAEMRELVSEYVVPKVEADRALLIVMRKGRFWNLPRHRNIVVYEGAETRSAYLSPKSRGGKALARHFKV